MHQATKYNVTNFSHNIFHVIHQLSLLVYMCEHTHTHTHTCIHLILFIILVKVNGIWWSKDITKNQKKMIYKSMVKSVLIYGAETWSLYEDDRRRINATDMDALRQSARIS